VEIAKSPRVTAEDLASIRMVMSGAAPMGKDLQDSFMAKIPNAVLGQVRLFCHKMHLLIIHPSILFTGAWLIG
jgi:hypothetical protein